MSNLQVAWEMLELAKNIYHKYADNNFSILINCFFLCLYCSAVFQVFDNISRCLPIRWLGVAVVRTSYMQLSI